MTPSFTSRRSLLAMLGVVTAGGSTALLAACGGEAAAPAKADPTKAPAAAAPAPTTAAAAAAPTKAPEPTKAAEAVEITFHSRGGPPTNQEVILYEEQMPLFMKKNANIKVKHEGFTGEDYVKKVTVLLAGGTIGDAMWTALGDGSIYNFAAMKSIIALDDLVAKEKFDLAQYYAGAIGAMKRDGKLYALPFKSHPGMAVMFYNKDLLAAKGVAGEPTKDWTLDQLVENGKKASAEGMYGYDPNLDQKTFLALTRAHGGELIDAEGKKSLLNSPEAVAAITWLYEAINKHKITPTPDQLKELGGDAKSFGAGKVAMLRRGTSFQIAAGQEVKDQFKWFVTVHPKGPKGVGGSDYEADGYAVTGASKKSAAAWEWVKWLTNQESGIRLGEIGGTVGGRPDVYKSDRLISKQPERKVFLEAMENAQPPRPAYNTFFNDYRIAMHEALMPLWTGKETPSKSFLDNANGLVQAVLDKPAPKA